MMNTTLFIKTSGESSAFSYLGIFFQLIFLIFVFIFVIFLAYYTTKIFAGAKMKTMKNNNMKIIETISIGFNNLHILDINIKYYLISSSKEGIRYLTELD
ncbi:MAG: flagellar biosynthetic protein FliO, partial [Eubacteriales bacterium]|nr:flagellar biosynthetic protein FliO [Eubacteriales bacterium]